MAVVTTSWQNVVDLINAQAVKSGLTQDQANAAIAVAQAEGGWNGAVGDTQLGGSYGIFQFLWNNVLSGFASFLNTSQTNAATIAQTQPQTAISYALGPQGYLYQAIKAGSAQGLSGADLAGYAEQYGQRSAPQGVTNAVAAWWTLFGKGVANPTVGATGAANPPGSPASSAEGAALSFGQGLIHLLAAGGLVIIALVLLILGIYLLARKPINEAVTTAAKAA
jgi:hypothetical protein